MESGANAKATKGYGPNHQCVDIFSTLFSFVIVFGTFLWIYATFFMKLHLSDSRQKFRTLESKPHKSFSLEKPKKSGMRKMQSKAEGNIFALPLFLMLLLYMCISELS